MTEPALLPRPQLRRLLRKARRSLSKSEQRQAAKGLYRQLAQDPHFRRAKHISLYLPTDGEIDPRLLLREAQRRGKATYLPVLSAWPIWRAEKTGASRRCWAWLMNVRRSNAWRKRVGMYRYKARSPTRRGISQDRRRADQRRREGSFSV